MKKKRLKPLGDRIIIRRVEPEKMTKSGLHIPDSAIEKMTEGEVIHVGTGRQQEDGYVRPLDVKVGDRVLFEKHAGTDIKVNGEELLILHEENLFGTLEEYEADEAPATQQNTGT